jgi:hypothetical protein
MRWTTIVGSTNINPAALRHQIRNNNYDEIENWLNEQNGSVMIQEYLI